MSEDQFNRLSESDKNFWTLLQKNLPIGSDYKDRMRELREVMYNRKPRGESYRLVERNPLDLGSLSLVSDLNENEASVEALDDCQEYAQ